MEGHVILLLFSAALFTLPSNLSAVDTIAAGQAIRDGETIVSASEMYELGFFSPGKSKNRYLGVWYKKLSTGTVVWIANRDTPLTNQSGVLRVTDEGNLQLLTGNDTLVWSSNPSMPLSNPVARILDTGNVIVTNGNGNDQGSFVWQSFDYPTDTLLPGMKLGKDWITGIERHLTSWKTPDDPSPGLYVMWVDTNGYPQIFQRQGLVLQLRVGPWNGLRFSGMPVDKPNTIYSVDFVFNENETYFKYELSGSVVQRIHLKWDGNSMQLNWIERVQDWVIYGTADVDSCGRYGLCGPYGRCSINKHPPCSCMEGFEPQHPGEWDTADWLGGCGRRKALDCGDGDGFQKISGVKFPDTRRSWYNRSMTLGECETACRRKCNCTAYASLDISDVGSGCLMWFNELLDVREYDESQYLYVRRAASELAGHTSLQSGSKKKKTIYAVVLSISLVPLVLLGLAVVVNVRRKKRSRMKEHANWAQVVDKNHSSVQKADLDQLPSFTLYEVAKATDYFSIDNKIGEGGFGPVYKGVLEEGQKVAVKRLSKTSEQGLDEFKNEVICIAKLQHRNLVRLLGYCVHGDEMILIYEYMANKSLDSFLFDKTRSLTLGWSQRFCIIQGIARGLLYLHQDSCLRIIHRDLKASNVLLDDDMNPKISDFGLARRFVGYDTIDKTKKVVGTYGYISPEYALHGRFSIKSDAFSFGVLVLEIVSGRKNREFTCQCHNSNLLGHAWRLHKEDKALEFMSGTLCGSCIVSQVLRSIQVGLLCVQNHAQDRPTMSSVVLMLGSEGVLPPPKQPAFFNQETWREAESISSVDKATITLLDAR